MYILQPVMLVTTTHANSNSNSNSNALQFIITNPFIGENASCWELVEFNSSLSDTHNTRSSIHFSLYHFHQNHFIYL